MRNLLCKRTTGVLASLFALVVAGCSSPGSAPLTSLSSRANSRIPNVGGRYLYASDPKHGVVHVYPLSGSHQTEVALLDHVPADFGLATDRAGNLYVSASGLAAILVYAPRTSRPFLTIKDSVGTNVPWGVAVSSTGDLAVANNMSLRPYRASHVSFFHRGAASPYATVTNTTAFAECIYDAYDDAGNLYVLGRGTDGRTTLGEIVDGGGKGHVLRELHVSGLTQKVGGIAVDGNGDVVVAEPAELVVFAPHSNRLIRTIVYGRGVNASQALALMPNGTDFYIGNDALNPAQLWEYLYPGGGRPINKIQIVQHDHAPIVEAGALAIAPPQRP